MFTSSWPPLTLYFRYILTSEQQKQEKKNLVEINWVYEVEK